MTARPDISVLEGGELSRQEFREQLVEPLLEWAAQLPGADPESELTIASGTVTPTGFAHTVDTEGDASSDDLTHMQLTNLPEGSIVQLRAQDGSRVPTLRHGATGDGQLLLAGSADLALSSTDLRIWFQRVGPNWVEIYRSQPAVDTLAGAVKLTGIVSPSQITGNQNNYDPAGLAGASTLRLSTDATRTITGLAGGTDGRVLVLENVGSNLLVLAHASGSSTAANRFLLPDSADLTIRPGRAVVLRYDGTASRWRAIAHTNVVTTGKHAIWLPAAAWRPTVTSGCAPLAVRETTAGRPDIPWLLFDAGADEHAQTIVMMPPSWAGDPLTFRVVWGSDATDTDGVAWFLQARVLGDSDSFDQAFGTAVGVTDAAQSAAEDCYITSESAALTPAGTLGGGKLLALDLYRDVSDDADTHAEDAGFIGLLLFYTVAAGSDA